MSVPAAYLGVILIWSTTPLAIQWSGEGPGYLFGVTSRMAIGAVVAFAVARALGVALPRHRRALATYLAAGLGIYGAMLSVYWAAQFIPSGWISVLFGLTPMVTGLLSALWLGERALTPWKLLGLLLGVAGLVVIFGEGGRWQDGAGLGVAGVLWSVSLHSASAVWIKRIGGGVGGLATTTGALLVAAPLFLVTWGLVGDGWPAQLGARAGLSILYLGILGSVLGFALYYFVLGHVSATRVALITLVTPVIALLLGHWVNGEPLYAGVWVGSGLILGGLLAFEFGGRVWRNKRSVLGTRRESGATR